ncbi:MAG: hypothetical protein AAGJ40_08750 [Planctomycetota bacterium]
MLDFSYPEYYTDLVRRTPWSVSLPGEWEGFFQESGVAPLPFGEHDARQRRIVRTSGLMAFVTPLPALRRTSSVVGIYTRDFSRDACGLLTSMELYPEEIVRVFLSTLCLQLRVVRCTRHNDQCFEVGAAIIHRLETDRAAFSLNGKMITA